MFMCVFCNGKIVLDKVWCKMFNYSIIIPHKNIPSLLRRCLDSIPERDDLEIIVVDDNSKEDTIRDLQTIHRNNLQIIYTKEGKGAGYARNVGISKAQGKWILFADADDFFLPNVIEKISPYSDCPQKLILFNSICRFSDDLTQNGDRDKICNKFSKIQGNFSAGKNRFHTSSSRYLCTMVKNDTFKPPFKNNNPNDCRND